VRTQKLPANHKSLHPIEAVSSAIWDAASPPVLAGKVLWGLPKGEFTNEVGMDRAGGPGLTQFKYHTIKCGVHREFLVGHSLVISGVSDSSLFIFI